MELKNTISIWLKTLACLAFVCAVVLSPQSSSHANSGMHGDHHSASVSAEYGDDSHVQDAHSSISDLSADDQTSGQCCSDICLSAVLSECEHNFVVQSAGGGYVRLHAQAASLEPSGFLRPPQFLI
jgi:hypothetical protein